MSQSNTGVAAMPIRGDRMCPVFDEKDPRSLNRYFSDLEALFKKHAVPDDNTAATQEERKKLAVRYLSWTIEASWSSLDKFDDGNVNYDGFKKAVFDLYPGVSSAPEWTIDDLNDLIDKRVTDGPVKDLNDYSRFYVEVRPVIKYLLNKNRINNIEANKALARAIGETHRGAVKSRLETDIPNRSANTPYTFEQFHKAMTYVLQHWNDDFDDIWNGSAPVGSQNASGGIAAPTPVRTAAVSMRVKQEDATAFANLITKQLVSTLSAMLPKGAMNPPPPEHSSARTPPPNSSNTFRRDLPMRPPTPRKGCYYCGADGCETKRCPEAAEDIAARKIKCKNGLLVMHNGSPIPYHLGQGTLHEKVNFYLDAKKANEGAIKHMLLDVYGSEEPDYALIDELSAPTLSEEDGAALEALTLQVNSLQVGEKKKPSLRFDGVEIIQRPRPFTGKCPMPPRASTPPPSRAQTPLPPRTTTPASARATPSANPSSGMQVHRSPTPGPSGPRASTLGVIPAAAASVQPPTASPGPNLVIPLHLYAKAKDATDTTSLSVRPAEPLHGVGGVSQSTAYCLESKASDPATLEALKEQVYNTELRLTVGQLLSSSSEVRKAIHNDTATRRVPVSLSGSPSAARMSFPRPPVPANQSTKSGTVFWELVPDDNDPAGSADGSDGASEASEGLVEGFTVELAEAPDTVVAAKDRNQIRTLWCKVNDTTIVECVLDGGSQIVAISEKCCNRLRIPIDTSTDLPIQSANGAVNKTVGLARNIPVQLPGDITVYLQMYVVKTTAYEVLLDCPFETLVHAKVENVGDAEQLITMRCPNTGATVRVATSAWGEKKASSSTPPAVFQA